MDFVSKGIRFSCRILRETYDWLGLDRDLGAELLSDTVEQEPGEPEVVTAASSARVLSKIESGDL